MSEEPAVEREDGESRGRYVIHLSDGAEAELTYARRGKDMLVADHTFVPPTHRGRGLAEKLVDTLIAEARRDGVRIEPVCSYVAAQFRRHPEWADLRV
jgi:predicted GNAT family acetyltransferase